MVGHIAAIGPLGVSTFDGAPLHLGDRVMWSMVWSCGQCFNCKSGLRPKCELLMKFGHHGLLGGFAEHCLLPEGTAISESQTTCPT